MKTPCPGFSLVWICLGLVGGGFLELRGEEENAEWIAFHEERLEELRRATGSVDQAAVIQKFASQDHVESTRYLIEMLGNRRAPNVVKSAIADVLGGYQSVEARSEVRKAMGRELDQNIYLLRAFVQYGEQEAVPWLLQLVADTKTPRARSLAIEGLNLISDSSVLAVGYWEALIEWMKDPEAFHGTRVEAAKALARWEDYHAVAALMEQLDDPLLREPVRDGLTRLTGQEFWGSRYSWKEWWKEQQGDYTPEPMDPEAFEAFEAEREKEAKENSSLEFFGVEITGKNILFVLDCSGSMWYEERITRLKDELNAMIGSLDPSYQFGLLLFPEASVPGKDFDEASDRYRERVQDFVNQMTADGETPMAAALHHAYKRIVSRENVDTIYLLSDGVPSDVTPEILLNEVAGYFEEFGTTIHTVFIGDDLEGQLLMDQVATVTGGRFVHVP